MKCSKCQTNEPRPGQRYCRACATEAQRRSRARRTKTDTERRHDACRSYASVYKHRGHLVAADTCELCGRQGELQMHHPDYDRPLLVVWLHARCIRIALTEQLVLDLTRAEAGERAARPKPRRTRNSATYQPIL